MLCNPYIRPVCTLNFAVPVPPALELDFSDGQNV